MDHEPFEAPIQPGDDAAMLDVETTGLDPNTARVVAIGVVRVRAHAIARTWSSLVNPGDIDDTDEARAAKAVHGIDAGDLATAPAFAAILQDLDEILADDFIVAHNAPFDHGCLLAELRRIDRSGHRAADPRHWLNTLELSRTRFPTGHHSLDALARRFSLRPRDPHAPHEAGADAALLARCWIAWGNAVVQQDLFADADPDDRPASRPGAEGLAPVLALPEPHDAAERHRRWAAANGYAP